MYKQIPTNKAYKLLNTGALVLVATTNESGTPNLAPIAWNTVVEYDPVTRLLIVSDKEHRTYQNIESSRQFTVAIPHASQHKLVSELGRTSGNDTNKVEKLVEHPLKTNTLGHIVPKGVIGYLEYKLLRIYDEDSVGIVVGEVINAMVEEDAFTDRLLSEKEEGKTLHHLGGKKFVKPGNEVF
jgi:flavin reductase (DIM6/NTAB) family NADH-FMN oxidoreductase RutF